MAGLGIYHYGARFYSPKLGRFISADTIVSGAGNSQAWNRYSYVLNNPLRYTDPTGHAIACDEEMSVKECKQERNLSRIKTTAGWKKVIRDEFGIKMSDDKNKWDTKNLEIIYLGLIQIDNGLGGKTKSFSEGSAFKLDGKAYGTYSGLTTGRTIIFYTGSTIPFQNLYHEFGHLLDNIYNDTFTNRLSITAQGCE